MVQILDSDSNPYRSFWWSSGDSLIHEGGAQCTEDKGPIASAIVERFSFTYDNTLKMFRIGVLQVRSSTGQRVQMESSFILYNAQ
jgi:hypothetical protein